MGIGLSLFAFALGAIFAFAVHKSPAGVSLQVIGVVVMIVGLIGFVTSMYFAKWRRKIIEESIEHGVPPRLDVDDNLIYQEAPPAEQHAPETIVYQLPAERDRVADDSHPPPEDGSAQGGHLPSS